MKRLTTSVLVAPLFAILSCGGNSNAHTETQTDTLKTASFGFSDWIKNLSVLDKPLELTQLKDVTGKSGPLQGDQYATVEAGILSGNDRFIAVIVKGTLKKENNSITYLITYTPDGKEIARAEVGMQTDGETDGTSIFKFPLADNDAMIEVREEWFISKKGEDPEMRYKTRFLKLESDGSIAAVPQETATFDAFAGRFNDISLPLTVSEPDVARLKPLSKLTPYYNFEELMRIGDVRAFHYGKAAIPGGPLYLLYATSETKNTSDYFQAPSVQLVSYMNGKEADHLWIWSASSSEGVESSTKDAVVEKDGAITLSQTEDADGPGSDYPYTGKFKNMYRYKPDASGKFVKTLTGLEFISPDFTAAALKKIMTEQQNVVMTAMILRFKREMPVFVHLKWHDQNGEQLVEFFTTDQAGKVLDRYQVYNTLKKTSYAEVSAKDGAVTGNQVDAADEKLEGAARLVLGNKTVTIAQDGMFVPQ
ncbi:hypothetical protein [Chitinophaga solisilvae]|uniref:hypothetical protein n=1 Tax=Chitinophaga solisilvae TaxID=1233460 RepID=UPI0013699A5F|nr:hypothetical protein [Chitinophaga solisilvae]